MEDHFLFPHFLQKVSKSKKLYYTEKGNFKPNECIYAIFKVFFAKTVCNLNITAIDIITQIYKIPILSWLQLIHLACIERVKSRSGNSKFSFRNASSNEFSSFRNVSSNEVSKIIDNQTKSKSKIIKINKGIIVPFISETSTLSVTKVNFSVV